MSELHSSALHDLPKFGMTKPNCSVGFALEGQLYVPVGLFTMTHKSSPELLEQQSVAWQTGQRQSPPVGRQAVGWRSSGCSSEAAEAPHTCSTQHLTASCVLFPSNCCLLFINLSPYLSSYISVQSMSLQPFIYLLSSLFSQLSDLIGQLTCRLHCCLGSCLLHPLRKLS